MEPGSLRARDIHLQAVTDVENHVRLKPEAAGGVFENDWRRFRRADLAGDRNRFEAIVQVQFPEQRAEPLVPIGNHPKPEAKRRECVQRRPHVLEPANAVMTSKVLTALNSWKFRPVLRGNEPIEVNAILGFNIDTNDQY